MIRIITDTASDITLRQAAGLDVDMVSLRVQFGDVPYEQLADENFEQFYKMLEESKELPVTSQPAPADYLNLFAKAKAAGDDVIVVTLSSGLSGTYQTACLAAEMADYERIYVVDSLSALTGQRMLVEHAARLRDEGRGAGEIYAILNDMSHRIVVFGALNTLKNLRKGGRIPKTAEVIGAVMGIKPLIYVKEDGAVGMAGKARGSAGAIAAMVKLVEKNHDFDPTVPVYFAYTSKDTLCRNFRKLCVSHFKLKNTEMYPAGASIGTHVGPDAFAVTYLSKTKGVKL